jgi:O-antigen/teichoic acid export membrane protein/glycosyltransferase involved in cell wall biosynthesis
MGVGFCRSHLCFCISIFLIAPCHLSIQNLMDDHKQRGRRLIAKNSIFNLLGQITPMLVGLLTIPYIVHGLGTAQYGILSIAMMLLGYFSIFDLGLSRATVKFVAENLTEDRVHKVPELVWTSLSLLIALGTIGGALAALFVPVSVTHFFKMPPSLAGEARVALFILCASMPIMLGNDALRGVLEACQRFDLVNCVKVPASILFYLVAALVIPFGVHVAGIVALLVSIRLISSFFYLNFCLRVIPGLRSNFHVSRAALGPLATFGGWIMVSNVTAPVFGYLERFMIASLLSVTMLTYYSAPYELVSKLLIFPMSIVPSLFPYFSLHASKTRSEVSDVTSRAVKYLFLVLTPPAAVFIFFARDIMNLWLGPQFALSSTLVLQLITVVFFLNAFAIIPFTSVQALGRPDLKAILDLVSIPIYIAVAWFLMRSSGINGAALAKLLLTISDGFFLYMFAFRLKAFSLRDCISGPLLRAILASAGLFLAVMSVHSLHFKLLLAAPLILLCFVAYLIAFWVFAVDHEDRVTIFGLRDRVLSLLNGRRSPSTVPLAENDAAALQFAASDDLLNEPQQFSMRINFLLPCYAWSASGGFKVVYEYANRLVARGHKVTVIHPRRLRFPPPEKRQLRRRLGAARMWLKEMFLRPVIDWHKMDPRVRLLYVPSSDASHIPDGDILFATAWHTVRSVIECPPSKGKQCYLIQHHETFMGPQSLVDDTWRAPLRKIVVSTWLADLAEKIGAYDTTHIPIGIDHELYRVIQPIAQRRRQVAMMFSHVPFKASADGIKALEIARRQFPDLKAVIFGVARRPASIPDWMTYVSEPTPSYLVDDILNTSSIVMSPSLSEGFGLPPAEGAACGCAMVATDSGGVRDFIIPGQTGLLSPPGDPEALAQNLCLLLANDDLRIRLAEGGRNYTSRFNWEDATNLLESFLQQTVETECPRPSSVLISSAQVPLPRLEMNAD